MRRIVCERIVAAFVSGKNVLTGLKIVRLLNAARRDADPVLIIHSVEQAGAALVAEPPLRPIGGCVPRQPVILCEVERGPRRPGRRPLMSTGTAALAAMAKGDLEAQLWHLKGNGSTFATAFIHHALPGADALPNSTP